MSQNVQDQTLDHWIDVARSGGFKNSMNYFIGDGARLDFDINFAGGYINKEDVKVYQVNPATGARFDTEIVSINGNSVRVDRVTPVGRNLVIYRDTDKRAPLVDFQDNSIVNERNLDLNAKQAIFAVAEMVDRFDDSVTFAAEATGAVEEARKARDEAIAAQVAAQASRDSASASQAASARSETAAGASATSALSGANRAEAAQSAAAISAAAAKSSEVKAKEAETTVVPLVPVVDKASKDAAAAAQQADEASRRAEQAVVDVKNLGAVPIGTVVEFLSGKALPAGYLDGNGSQFDGMTYPDLQTYLGSTTLPNLYGGGDFLGKMIWVNHRSKIPANYVGADGQSIQAVDAPAMKAAVSAAAGVWSITETAWQNDPYSRGAFSTGDGTYFRMPDINGKSNGSVGSLFIRGDGKDAGSWSGMIQGDAIRNITGKHMHARIDSGDSVSGVFSKSVLGWSAWQPPTNTNAPAVEITFDASLVVPTANENRPKSVTGVWCICIKVPTIRAIKAAGVLSNEGMAQLAGVKLALTSLYKNFIGVPIPWGNAPLPAGYAKMNGAAFDKVANPLLAAMYPSGVLPDLRGEFLRGFDDGRGVDTGRVIGSQQGDEIKSHDHYMFRAHNTGGNIPYVSGSSNPEVQGEFRTGFTGGTETRPRNIAMLYICMTDAALPI